MDFEQLNPGDRFHALDTGRFDEYEVTDIFERYGPESIKQWDAANALNLTTGEEFTFPPGRQVKVI